MFETVSAPPTQRLSDLVASQLERLIVEGRLTPGEGLPSERELAKQIGVSRASLREALSELRSRGLIEPARNGGAVVADLTRRTLTEPLSQMLERYPSAMWDLMEMRAELEAHSALLAAQRATAADIAALDAALELQIAGRSRKVATLAKRDLDFHLLIAKASHNIALLHTTHSLAKLLQVLVQRGYGLLLGSEGARRDLQTIAQQHAAILDAIRNRDAEAAKHAAQEHLRSTAMIWRLEAPSCRDHTPSV
jgi:GntR family transcriptional regulator, transcriptional repressor for pyruvate dehydrogenase complex